MNCPNCKHPMILEREDDNSITYCCTHCNNVVVIKKD